MLEEDRWGNFKRRRPGLVAKGPCPAYAVSVGGTTCNAGKQVELKMIRLAGETTPPFCGGQDATSACGACIATWCCPRYLETPDADEVVGCGLSCGSDRDCHLRCAGSGSWLLAACAGEKCASACR
jgi:hypothetical protein